MNKGITIWEQHVEKIILGLAVLILLGALALLVMGSPNVTQVGNSELTPGEVNQELMNRANDLRMKLDSATSQDAEKLLAAEAASAQDYLDRLSGTVSPATQLPGISPSLARVLLPDEVGSVDVLYYEPLLVAPRMVAQVQQTRDTIEESEANAYPELASYFEGDALDIAWATPVAEIDLVALRDELAGSDQLAQPPLERIPATWYNEKPYILDIEFQRREVLANGRFGPTTVVGAIPGARSLRDKIDGDEQLEKGFRDEIFINFEDPMVQKEILQPDFYSTLNARFMTPRLGSVVISSDEEPVDEKMSEEEKERLRQVNMLQRRLKQRTFDAKDVSSRLEELGGPLRDDEKTSGGDKGRGGRGGRGGDDKNKGPGGGGPGGPGGGFGGKKTSGGNSSEETKRARLKLAGRLEKLESDIERIKEELSELAPEISNEVVSAAAVPAMNTATDERLLAWTHDLDVQAGSGYQYRAVAKIFNPLFGQERQLLTEQAEKAKEIVLATSRSEWSNTVMIEPPVQFFFVRANDEGGSMGLGEAKVELYRYHNGRQRVESFIVQPGERIGQPTYSGSEEVDFTTEWYLVDVVKDSASKGENGLDSDEDAIVICRHVDGTETQIRIPSSQVRDPERTRLSLDAKATQASR